ncbi:GGDEF domain-containing protein [Aliikangiella maris]|uniref:diguanylate cyclase n=2 Tax=Aliikangiella maris TaxID=3162458 RepID=A0ABV2BSS3_9GAMM
MSFQLIKLHRQLLINTCGFILLTLILTFSIGSFKSTSQIEISDILGEGGIALISLIWIIAILISRPAGRVTRLLVYGLLFLHISLLLDLLDEFLIYPANHTWLTAYESIPAPIGMILMSIALYHWHNEQIMLNQQLQNRERYYREHALSDYVTGLYSAQYMHTQIQMELARSNNSSRFCLLMVDVDNFDYFVRQFGDTKADRLLREIANLILMNLRTTDLACRYSGDRFIILLPDTHYGEAIQISYQLETAINALAFKPEKNAQAFYHRASISLADSKNVENLNDLYHVLNSQMAIIKQDKSQGRVA